MNFIEERFCSDATQQALIFGHRPIFKNLF